MDTRTRAKKLETPDQTLLVLLAQAGDRSALEQLLRHAYAPTRLFHRRLAAGRPAGRNARVAHCGCLNVLRCAPNGSWGGVFMAEQTGKATR